MGRRPSLQKHVPQFDPTPNPGPVQPSRSRSQLAGWDGGRAVGGQSWPVERECSGLEK